MTSPLVKPTSGNNTLSRLDSSIAHPSISTGNRLRAIVVLLQALPRRLVRSQPQETRKPQPVVGRTVAVLHLDHQFGPDPVGAAGIVARHRRTREGRLRRGERPERVEQLSLGRRPDPAANAPPEVQPPVAVR